ncbi:hypothetical protein F5880DRAFT_1508846 [Lentinula raphanica]|nr:hypothetical protein F5880DRAFT_1508846 [Lentinula raphanica]
MYNASFCRLLLACSSCSWLPEVASFIVPTPEDVTTNKKREQLPVIHISWAAARPYLTLDHQVNYTLHRKVNRKPVANYAWKTQAQSQLEDSPKPRVSDLLFAVNARAPSESAEAACTGSWNSH